MARQCRGHQQAAHRGVQPRLTGRPQRGMPLQGQPFATRAGHLGGRQRAWAVGGHHRRGVAGWRFGALVGVQEALDLAVESGGVVRGGPAAVAQQQAVGVELGPTLAEPGAVGLVAAAAVHQRAKAVRHPTAHQGFSQQGVGGAARHRQIGRALQGQRLVPGRAAARTRGGIGQQQHQQRVGTAGVAPKLALRGQRLASGLAQRVQVETPGHAGGPGQHQAASVGAARLGLRLCLRLCLRLWLCLRLGLRLGLGLGLQGTAGIQRLLHPGPEAGRAGRHPEQCRRSFGQAVAAGPAHRGRVVGARRQAVKGDAGGG